MEYNFKEIEAKWQSRWRADKTYKVETDPSRPKFYVLDMFPYPSGAGLHVGHPLGYIASDIYSRYKRLKGFNVLHPMGYDAFGLPAEQYAIQTGQHPAVTTEQNIARYREQLDKIGFSFDWDREVRTCDPGYYKWTQWAFLEMFSHWYDRSKQQARPVAELTAAFETSGTEGLDAACTTEMHFTAAEWNAKSEREKEQILQNYRLAFRADTQVNWCPKLGTVLANDEVHDGLSVRGGYPVEQKRMKQWLLRVTAYAQRMLDGLDKLEWSDSLKEIQRNWIGRSEGAQVFFDIENSDRKLEIFTTRPDTIFGVTFMVIAPEHEWVGELTTPENKAAVEEYIAQAKKRSERERIAAYLKERGYYNFSVNNISYAARMFEKERLIDLRLIVKQYLTGYDERGLPVMDNNMVYRIDRINIFPDYDPTVARTDTTLLSRLDTVYYRGLNIIYEKRPNLRPPVLRQAVPLYPNYVYNSSQVNRAYSDLMALGYFKSAKIAFEEQPRSADVTDIVSFIGASADSTQTLYTREGYLTCNILCTPTLKQSVKVDLEGSTTSSFYGLKATVGYQNRNIFRGAESFDLSFTAGYEFMKAPDARRKRATEFGVTTGLTFPRFLVPWRTGRFRTVNQPKTKVELSINFQDRPYYARTLSSAGITYMWTNSRYSSFSLRPIDINVVDMTRPVDPEFLGNTSNKYLINSFKTQFIGGLSFGYGYNNQRKNLGGNATNIRFNAETAGNLIDAVEHAFFSPAKGKEQYTIFGIEYSQYFRTDLSVSRKIMLGGATALVGRLYGGVAMAYGNSSSVPFDRQFYCGGSNGMRGWTPRTLGQGSVANPHNDFPVQTGDVKLEANLELRFPVWGMIHGATFFDLGNIWYIRHYSGESEDTVFRFDRFYKQLGFNTGLGLRFDIKFAVLRLDWGIQLHNPNNPSGERWIHNFKWKNTALNFGVGYPF